MSRQAWRYKTLPANTKIVESFCTKYQLELKRLNNGYQLRIEDTLDVYPVRARYHILRTGERGGWDTPEELRRLMLKATEVKIPPIKIEGFGGGLDMSSNLPAPNFWHRLWRRFKHD